MKRQLFILLLLFFGVAQKSFGTHLLGGYISANYIASTSTNVIYKVHVFLFRTCEKDFTKDYVPFDADILLCAYDNSGALYNSYTADMQNRWNGYARSTSCGKPSWACMDTAVYSALIMLPLASEGYTIEWQRCCLPLYKNLKTDNSGVPYQGMALAFRFPKADLKNHAPVMNQIPLSVACLADTSVIAVNVYDPDGDSLSWELIRPAQGTGSSIPIITSCANNLSSKPSVDFASGYTYDRIFGSGGFYHLDSFTGTEHFYDTIPGLFLVGKRLNEYRKGVKIAEYKMYEAVLVKDSSEPGKYWNLGTQSLANETALQIVPNPAKDKITLSASTVSAFQWQIFSASGRLMLQGNTRSGEDIDVSALASGMYIFKSVSAGNANGFRQRLVICR